MWAYYDTDNTVCFSAILLFLAVSIFGGECWRRDWLMYPNFNYLSWSYGLAVISMFFHGFAAFFVYLVSSYTLIFVLHYYSAMGAKTVYQEKLHMAYTKAD
jgi:hypothetical protein